MPPTSRIPISRRLDPYEWHLAVDLIIFTVANAQLHVLMKQRTEEPYAGTFVLPGALVKQPLSADETVTEVLFDQVGDVDARPVQFHTFANRYRDPRGWVASIAYIGGAPFEWLKPTTGPGFTAQLVSVGLADGKKAYPNIGGYTVALGFDHADILIQAALHLRATIGWSLLGFRLLPERFTLLDLQKVHEAVLGRDLPKQTFRNRMLNRVFADGRRLTPCNERRPADHRPAQLYMLA